MRVFLSVLIILALVGCNSATDEVAVEETTVEVIADSVPLVVEEVDTVETKVEEEKKEEDEDLEVNAANDRLSKEAEYSRMEDEKMKLISKLKKGEAIRIHCDTLYKLLGGFNYEEDGMIDINDNLFSGICFETYENGTIKYETEYIEGERRVFRSYYKTGQIYYSSENIYYSEGPYSQTVEEDGVEFEFWSGWGNYKGLNHILFYYETGEKKGDYEHKYAQHYDIYTGNSWYKNGKLSRQVKLINEEEEDHDLMETVVKCFDEKGNEIDCENVMFTECFNCDQPPLDK